MSCVEPAGQQGGKLGAEALEHDRVNNYIATVQDALGLSGWHKMQYLQQQHSYKELGLREPLEGKMGDPRYFGFGHCCIKMLKKSRQSSEAWVLFWVLVWVFFSELVLILFPPICQGDIKLSVPWCPRSFKIWF